MLVCSPVLSCNSPNKSCQLQQCIQKYSIAKVHKKVSITIVHLKVNNCNNVMYCNGCSSPYKSYFSINTLAIAIRHKKLTIGVLLKIFSIAVVQAKVISCKSANKSCLLQVVHTKAITAMTQFCDFFYFPLFCQ